MAAKKEMTFILQKRKRKKKHNLSSLKKERKKTLLNTWGHCEQGGR